jgi:hypothetical protein
MLLQPVHPDHPSTAEDREPNVAAGPELRGEAGSMPNRAEVMRPDVELLVWLDPDVCQRLPYNIPMDTNQALQEVQSISSTMMRH